MLVVCTARAALDVELLLSSYSTRKDEFRCLLRTRPIKRNDMFMV